MMEDPTETGEVRPALAPNDERLKGTSSAGGTPGANSSLSSSTPTQPSERATRINAGTPIGPMKRMLKAGSVGVAIPSWILDTICTCRTCRQNKELEADPLLCKTWQVWHIIDRTNRWHNVMKFLISSGCEVHERACGQHARMPEHGEVLPCHSVYNIESWPNEGVTWAAKTLLVNCILAGNARSNAREMAWFVSRFGSAPALLFEQQAPQQLQQPQQQLQQPQQPHNEALQEDHRPGDLVKRHRDPKEEDTPGWREPIEVFESISARGCVKLKRMCSTIHRKHKVVHRCLDISASALLGHLGIQHSPMSALPGTSHFMEQWPIGIVHYIEHMVEDRHSPHLDFPG